ncbi:MAG: DUF134 domain-containing protein [Bacteroidales bacterium]|nr:DUF134 domain-containing protein [Bacteroidales bacterium]MCF8458202.1 DUF134 domain-containing protein [Bacteroidales bacterium]
MPRRKRLRKVVAPPSFKGYRPYGHQNRSNGFVELLYEEYEALKLADYDLMSHHDACVLMGVSRPTFARIYESARRKIALALVETKEIRSVYGNAFLDKSWFSCGQCNTRFTMPETLGSRVCPMCKSSTIEIINQD